VPARSSLKIADRSPDGRDSIVWRWATGAATEFDELGDLFLGDRYTLCLYDQVQSSGGVPVSARLLASIRTREEVACGGAECWRASGTRGLKYRDRERLPDGIKTLSLRAGDEGRAGVSLRGRGENLGLPGLAGLDPPVAVRLHGSAACFGADYATPIRNADGVFRAKGE
jgi:hypothetical protein